MAGCETMTFQGVTEAVWSCLRQQAKSMGIPVPEGGSGTASAQGASAEFRWNPASGSLSVTFTSLPPWVSCTEVEQRLRAAVRSCGGQ